MTERARVGHAELGFKAVTLRTAAAPNWGEPACLVPAAPAAEPVRRRVLVNGRDRGAIVVGLQSMRNFGDGGRTWTLSDETLELYLEPDEELWAAAQAAAGTYVLRYRVERDLRDVRTPPR